MLMIKVLIGSMNPQSCVERAAVAGEFKMFPLSAEAKMSLVLRTQLPWDLKVLRLCI